MFIYAVYIPTYFEHTCHESMSKNAEKATDNHFKKFSTNGAQLCCRISQ